ncbi:hypothetical protein [Photobacterium carnosum]|uniref:hypothetical protein n=1 Tax=Photobacterium carnosum TaxID=2023717 RepID=UPI001E59A190|nr:hypothetical protein [Photobacterium carnosum]MCD9517057.1 hypothetical protein [Photobacterium carnosum]
MSNKRLRKLNGRLNDTLLEMAKLEDTANAVRHQLKPMAFEVAQKSAQHPAVELINSSIIQFKNRYGKEPETIRIPPAILKQLLDLLPDEDQKLFWVAPIKKLGGLIVDVSEDGTLVIQ